MAAKTLKELRMDWIVELTDGTSIGPLNIFAAIQFAKEGSADTNARFINKDTGETRTLDTLPIAEMIEIEEKNKSMSEELIKKEEILKGEKKHIQELEEELARAKTKQPAPKAISQQIRKMASVPRS